MTDNAPRATTDALSKRIDETAARIGEAAALKERRSAQQYVGDIVSRVLTAILGVTSPVLVTYSTNPAVSEDFKIYAILLTALAGAATTTQAVFAFQQSSIWNATQALDLYQVKAQLESDKEAAFRNRDDNEIYADLKIALQNAMRGHRDITVTRERARLEERARAEKKLPG